jgi:chemotaxis protein MotB
MAKGGGAWKVAYADFVTAMMAFFMVMWLIAQDQDKKEAITRYFNDPLGINPMRVSKSPDSQGSLFDRPIAGDVTDAESVAMSSGRQSYSSENETSPATKLIGDHLFSSPARMAELEAIARHEMEKAEKENPDKPLDAEQAAINQLSSAIRGQILRELPADMAELQQSLLYESINSVNWRELAEDILNRSQKSE